MKYCRPIKTIFIGTPDFGVPSLRALINDQEIDVALVITQPDMPVGRKQIITASPVKQVALENQLKVLQPEKIKTIVDQIRQIAPDVIIVIAYAQIIPKSILDIPKLGCVNLHGSLLPKYRGAAVIQAPILNGDQSSGLTLIKMDEGIDTGPIISQVKIKLDSHENGDSLYNKLSAISADFLVDSIKKYADEKIKPIPQADTAETTYFSKIKKADGLIEWHKSAAEIERFIRAMHAWPSAWTWHQGKQVKIIEVQQTPIEMNAYKPGKTFIYNHGLAVQCGHDSLIIKKIQMEGKKVLTAEEFIRGNSNFVGAILS
jgi:methionyl-tRNA formyltransferase